MHTLDNMPGRTPYNQVRRIWSVLLMLVNAPGPLPISEIKSRLREYDVDLDDRGQTDRNIHRDIAFLREMGYQIDNLRGQGYLLHGKSEILPIMFSKQQLEAVCLGRELFAAFEGTDFGDAIDDAYEQISQIYKKRQKQP